MSSKDQSIHGIWGRWIFILAATGSAVGLGNIWKFPYITGENGGGAFVLVYLLCISLVGIPIMIAEVALGRKGRKSPINSVKEAANEADVAHWWQGIGWMGALAGFFILSFYSVIAGWALAYIPKVAMGTFTGADASCIALWQAFHALQRGEISSALVGQVEYKEEQVDRSGAVLWHLSECQVKFFLCLMRVFGY